MLFNSQKFLVTKVKNPKSVYIKDLNIETGDILQVKFTIHFNIYISNISKGSKCRYDRSALKRVFDTCGCIEFKEIESQDKIEIKQPSISL